MLSSFYEPIGITYDLLYIQTVTKKKDKRIWINLFTEQKEFIPIFYIAKELKIVTIEKVMDKSDLELGIECLKKFF